MKNKEKSKHIRISEHWHRQIKMKAAREKRPLNQVTEMMIRSYFTKLEDLPLDGSDDYVDDMFNDKYDFNAVRQRGE